MAAACERGYQLKKQRRHGNVMLSMTKRSENEGSGNEHRGKLIGGDIRHGAPEGGSGVAGVENHLQLRAYEIGVAAYYQLWQAALTWRRKTAKYLNNGAWRHQLGGSN